VNSNTSTGKPPALHIDMVSDVVCPWCAIGYQYLQQALQRLPELEVELVFQPFELNPKMPPEGQNVNQHIAEKYGSDAATIKQNRQQLHSIGEAVGVVFKGDDDSRIYNTFLAHKLLLKAETLGNQQRLQMALMQAYFGENQDISSGSVLLDIAIECGFTREQAKSALTDQELAQQVHAREAHYRSMDITAVPTFIFNQQYMISGAQDADVLCDVISTTLENSGAN
jgi:predicted DsbA family dithiol-disulfide isomerase